MRTRSSMSSMKFTNMSDLLKATPFDPGLSPTISEEAFYKDFYVELESFKKLVHGLHDLIDNPYQENRVVFINGYSGNGKTTFLKSFIRTYHQQYYHVYYAVAEWRGASSAGPGTRSAPDSVMQMMNRELCTMPDIEKTFAFVDAHRDALRRDDFISRRLYHSLQSRGQSNTVVDESFICACLEEFEFRDTFAILFI